MRTLSCLLLAVVPVSAVAAAPPADSQPASAPPPRGVLVDFTATWCGPCQEMSPIVKRLWREGHPVRKVDIDASPELARKFNITGIPAFVLLVDGKEVARVVGRTSETNLRQMLAQIPPAGVPAANVAAAEPARPAVLPASSPAASPRASVPAAATPVRNFPATYATADFEEPVIRANFDRAAGPERIRAAEAVVGDPLAASARIRVKDKNGVNLGSGTIVDSLPGRTVVLSCGHIFRDLEQDSTIEVDVFHDGRFETFLGKVLRYDLEGDVGLISIPTGGRLPVCRVAGAAGKVAVADRVTSIGCGKGDPPSAMPVQVTRLNRYIGPENIECTGVPIQGRSGGGLFDSQGRVVGVCIAADNRDQRGLYAGLAPIHDLLDRCELSDAYRPTAAVGALAAASSVNDQPAVREAAAAVADGEFVAPAAVAVASPPGRHPAVKPAPADEDPFQDEARDAAVAEALASAGDAEVICIIRAHDDPQANSRVVIINRASPKFVSYLTGELAEQPQTVAHRASEERIAADVRAARKPAAEPEDRPRAAAGAAATEEHAADRGEDAPPQPYRRSR
ncbi:MAG: thioredoxin domain-containing protein [Planctomycetales bacterium]